MTIFGIDLSNLKQIKPELKIKILNFNIDNRKIVLVEKNKKSAAKNKLIKQRELLDI